MTSPIIRCIVDLAQLRRIQLRPGWADPLGPSETGDETALAEAAEVLGWAPPRERPEVPKAHEYPLFVYHTELGWGVAERFEDQLRIVTGPH